MSLVRIFGYFVGEATWNLWRSWKVSLLAILTIATSGIIGGSFLLLSGNLSRVVQEWSEEAKVIVYLHDGLSEEEAARVRSRISKAVWVTAVERISPTEARALFRATFPSVSHLLEGFDSETLPASFEVSFESLHLERAEFDVWLTSLRREPGVLMVDDDRDWLRQLQTLIDLLQGVGFVVGTLLLGAAVVNIASVIRLTAYLYRDEIAVMRLVGATELYIRGPFYFEGLIQGFLGGLLALVTLYAGYLLVNPRGATVLVGTMLVEQFLPWHWSLLLLGAATLAGCVGAVMSLRREALVLE